jgi:hypothetical protein
MTPLRLMTPLRVMTSPAASMTGLRAMTNGIPRALVFFVIRRSRVMATRSVPSFVIRHSSSRGEMK